MKAEYLYHSGSDIDVVNAAKVSFNNRSTEITNKEINLINYLGRGLPSKEYERLIISLIDNSDYDTIAAILDTLKHTATHWAPFTHNSITLRMSAPIPIRTQAFKHKIGFTESEESRRYITSTPELHIPEAFHTRPDNIKQGASNITNEHSDYYLKRYKHACNRAIAIYEQMINNDIAPEEARYILPQGVITNWIWTGNLASYARYYNQRSDTHAQGDSRLLAEEVRAIVEPLFPYSWKALTRNA